MAQPDNWMQGDNPASDTCEPPLRDEQQSRGPLARGRAGGARSANRIRNSHLQSSALSASVLEDVVPHLLRSFSRTETPAQANRRQFGEPVVQEFTHAILDADETIASRLLDELRGEGATAEELYLGLFSDTARLLGYYWETDVSPFTEVTLGLWRLHRMVRDLSPEFRREGVRSGVAMQALLTTAPGEQHSFGLLLVSEWFSRAGWAIQPGPFDTDRDIGRAVGADPMTVVGFSVSSEINLDKLAASIAIVRRKSLNPKVGIMVGGSLFNSRPDLVARVGADTTAGDAAEALSKAQQFAISGQWASA